MSGSPDFTEEELRVYGQLIDGRVQASVARALDLGQSKVSRITKRLVSEGYIRPKGHGRPQIYEKGPKAPHLDKLYLSLHDAIYASGVTHHADEGTPSSSILVHHLKYRANVLHEGDLEKLVEEINGQKVERPFLTQYFDRRNVTRYKGQLAYLDKWVSVEYERTPSMQTFYVCPPQMDITLEDMRKDLWDDIAKSVVQDILNKVSRLGKWQFGLLERCNWDVHYGIESHVTQGFADHIAMKSADGKTYLSHSDGRSEMETTDAEYAKVWVELPGEVYKLRLTVQELSQAIALLAKCNIELANGQVAITTSNIAQKAAQATANGAQAAQEPRPEQRYGGVDYIG